MNLFNKELILIIKIIIIISNIDGAELQIKHKLKFGYKVDGMKHVLHLVVI